MRLRRMVAGGLLVLGLVGGTAGTALASEVPALEDIEIGPCTDAEVKVKIPTPYGYLVLCVDAKA